MKRYEITCLQNAPFDSWDGVFTEEELIAKFWDYVPGDGIFDHDEDGSQWFDSEGEYLTEAPEQFTLKLIEGIWQVEFTPKEVTVKCNNCGWCGNEEDLVSFEDGEGPGKGCPTCETDNYLADIPFKLTVSGLIEKLKGYDQNSEVVFNHGETILKFDEIGFDDQSDIVDIFVKEQ